MELKISDIDQNLVNEIKEKVRISQLKAMQAVNAELISLYFEIGRLIYTAQSTYSWGNKTIDTLSKVLRSEFHGSKGFSRRNLYNILRFYNKCLEFEFVQTLSTQISWSHTNCILENCKTKNEILYYMLASQKFAWSYRVLEVKIDTKDYERTLSSQNNFDLLKAEDPNDSLVLAVKDSYVFNFLNLGNKYTEKDLEGQIVENVTRFLSDMNGKYHFVGNQYKLKLSNQVYSVDLLFYNTDLECYIAIELKIGEFKPEYAGKIAFYLSLIDKQLKKDTDKPSIGIILCKNKNRTLVEYSLQSINKKVAVANYTSHKELPKHFAEFLPSEQELTQKLSGILKAKEMAKLNNPINDQPYNNENTDK